MIILNLLLSLILIGIISGIISTIPAQFDNQELSSFLSLEPNTLNIHNKFIGLPNAFGELLFSTTGPILIPNTGSGSAAPPTFNPPLKSCPTTETAKEGGFDLAKYMITGDLDKNDLKSNDFDFQIFADLVKDDEAEIEGRDAPYKASILTDNTKEKSKVKLEEIATICIDVQHVVNVDEKTRINLDNSEVFKSLGY